jgi:hypothetical protein
MPIAPPTSAVTALLFRAGLIFGVLAMLMTPFVDLAGAQVATPPMAGHDHGHMDDQRKPSPEEQAAADRLVEETRAGVARYADSAVAERDGYRPVSPFSFYGARAAHFQRDESIMDDDILDPENPEFLIYLKDDTDQLSLVGAMFLAPIGGGPDIGGPLTNWHSHDDLCANYSGLAPVLPGGDCPQGTLPLQFEMLHIWLIDHPDGPFAEEPPASIITVTTPWDETGGSLAVVSSLIDWDAMLSAIGDLLGLDPDEIMERGVSWAELAADQGVPRADLEDIVSQRLAIDYDQAVENGDMLPAQRDLLVDVLPSVIGRLVELHKGEPWYQP